MKKKPAKAAARATPKTANRRSFPRKRESRLGPRNGAAHRASAMGTPRGDERKGAAVTMTAADAVVETLIAHGLDTVYALPGVQNDQLFEALFRASDRLRTIHTRHEQGAAYMALGAALATGKPQAYAVVPGPGLLNSSAALLTAYSMNAPVLALIGQIPDADIGRHLGHLHEIRDQAGIIDRLVDHSTLIRKPAQAARATARGDAGDAPRPARPGGAGMRHGCVGQIRRDGDPRAAAAGRRHDRQRRHPPRGQATRRGEAADDRLRRRRAGCVAPKSPRCRRCCRRRCSAIAAAAACSTAAIR